MAFLDSFTKPRTGFNEVLSGLEQVTGRLAESFAKDPAIRTERKIARIRKQEREADREDKQVQSTVERLRFMGKLVSGIISEGNTPPPVFGDIIKSIVNSDPGNDLVQQEGEIALQMFQQPPPGQEFEGASPVGKLQQDRIAAVEQFGEDSPQVQQIDAVIGQATTEPVQPLNLVFEDGRKVGFDRVTQKDEIIAAFEEGAVPVSLSVQGQSLGDLRISPDQPPPAVSPAPTVPPGGIALGTGASGALGGLVNRVFDLFGANLPFPNVEAASKLVNDLQVQTQLFMTAEVPGRASNQLREIIKSLTVTPESLAQGDQRSATRFRNTRDLIAREVTRMNTLLENPQGLTKADISDLRSNSQQLQALLGAYDAVVSSIDNSPLSEDELRELKELRAKQSGG